MSYPRAFRDDLISILEKYQPSLTVYYNSYGDMLCFYGTFIIKENVIYIKQTSDPEASEKPLNVISFLELLNSATEENLEVSTYHESYRGGNTFDCNMILDNIYFR